MGAVIDWESKFCATSGCQPAVMDQAREIVSSSCKKDIKKERIVPLIALSVLKRGVLVTDLICVADKKKKGQDYCFRKVLSDLEVGQIAFLNCKDLIISQFLAGGDLRKDEKGIFAQLFGGHVGESLGLYQGLGDSTTNIVFMYVHATASNKCSLGTLVLHLFKLSRSHGQTYHGRRSARIQHSALFRTIKQVQR